MSRIAYANGAYLNHKLAAVSIDDRGFQFADGVYEVCPVSGSEIVDMELHFERLERSLVALQIPWPVARKAMAVIIREVVARNKVEHGLVYLQVTRGVAPRDHAVPDVIKPSLVVTAHGIVFEQLEKVAAKGVRVITIPDIRWQRRDIKSLALLPNVLARTEAKDQGASEAWMVDSDGMITEGSSTNAWIVTDQGEIVTRPTGNDILSGITRMNILDLAREANIPVIERPFSVAEAEQAAEAFLTSSTRFCFGVIKVNASTIGDGTPGPITMEIRRLLLRDAGLLSGNMQ